MTRPVRQFIKAYEVAQGKGFRLKDFDPADTGEIEGKEQAQSLLLQGHERLRKLQEKLYADDRWSVLLIFQAMDAAGKDGAIKHVMSGVNPQGCQVFSFKAPSAEDLDHDFLWRSMKNLPERGRIGIFNRSYYEETLVVRVHPELLEKQRLPTSLVTRHVWDERFEDIRHFERYLSRNGVLVRKIFLNVSQDEQKRRFLKRLEDPQRNWKFSASDLQERRFWKDYMHCYQDMISQTATDVAPWYVVPADHKWYARLVVAGVLIDALENLDLSYPHVSGVERRALREARQMLQSR